ncbi:uncharacterized protein EURHEDRAFT_380784 [Aspergillus ruber CBS 135680]|uniref:Ricin B lectin domain-containing protein n=1 Tax=Aspergillus ruber (strain CBS 135680) TaxID=1388766 RepID=A0A017S6R4_ASPRC|nr:uncharacterized protein EURHEDRAFT_380784 [Aspergillus ruber CBS 135680]EYE91860.1 hypothetical protein EURHEDRAFT_380784 [Aspergillus ruber CBS 135680]
MPSSQFDPKRYYRISNTVNNSTLALGVNATEPPPPLSITSIGKYRSENWQIFYDKGVYFIRNLDYESRYQLGLNASDQSTPSMMETGSGLGMQWNITTNSGDDSGVWELKNLLVGQANMLALGPSSLTKKVPVMNTNPTEGKWMIDINPSAGDVADSMVSPFPSIEVELNRTLHLDINQ